jgi:hypothetical protein
VSSKDSSDADADAIDIDNIPDTLTDKQVDMGATVGSGSYKTARNFDWGLIYVLRLNLMSYAPLIFCTTKPGCSILKYSSTNVNLF